MDRIECTVSVGWNIQQFRADSLAKEMLHKALEIEKIT